MDVQLRIDRLNWLEIENSLHQWGYAKTPPLLTSEECSALIDLYGQDHLFRNRIDMQRHGFGIGEYKYFADPLPDIITQVRSAAYARLAPIANTWTKRLGLAQDYPPDLESFLRQCADHGQTRPTPLLLRYREGCYNCLHQDLYGEIAFVLQLAIVLSSNLDYEGGHFLLVEQRPRAQSRGEAILLEQGEAIIFTNRYRPVESKRGYYRAQVRHGVSRLTRGTRYTLGIIFHNAK
jgi:hypothetical protein